MQQEAALPDCCLLGLSAPDCFLSYFQFAVEPWVFQNYKERDEEAKSDGLAIVTSMEAGARGGVFRLCLSMSRVVGHGRI